MELRSSPLMTRGITDACTYLMCSNRQILATWKWIFSQCCGEKHTIQCLLDASNNWNVTWDRDVTKIVKATICKCKYPQNLTPTAALPVLDKIFRFWWGFKKHSIRFSTAVTPMPCDNKSPDSDLPWYLKWLWNLLSLCEIYERLLSDLAFRTWLNRN